MNADKCAMHLRLLALAALVLAGPATAASRDFGIDDFDRVRLDGPYKVQLATGVAPFARATGSSDALDGLSINVEDGTLIIAPNGSTPAGFPGHDMGPVTIAIGTHDLDGAWINGAGSLAIDQVKEPSFQLTVQGAGAASIGKLRADELRLAMSGSGSAAIAGTAPAVNAVLRGASSFDGSDLKAKDATLAADGTAVIKLIATDTATVTAAGPVTISLGGGPACTVHAEGAPDVSGCRDKALGSGPIKGIHKKAVI